MRILILFILLFISQSAITQENFKVITKFDTKLKNDDFENLIIQNVSKYDYYSVSSERLSLDNLHYEISNIESITILESDEKLNQHFFIIDSSFDKNEVLKSLSDKDLNISSEKKVKMYNFKLKEGSHLDNSVQEILNLDISFLHIVK